MCDVRPSRLALGTTSQLGASEQGGQRTPQGTGYQQGSASSEEHRADASVSLVDAGLAGAERSSSDPPRRVMGRTPSPPCDAKRGKPQDDGDKDFPHATSLPWRRCVPWQRLPTGRTAGGWHTGMLR